MNIFMGYRPDEKRVKVTVGSRILEKVNLVEFRSGFDWGFRGIAPRQLAAAILANDVNDEIAKSFCQQFEKQVIAELPHNKWVLTTFDVREFLENRCDVQLSTIVSNQQP